MSKNELPGLAAIPEPLLRVLTKETDAKPRSGRFSIMPKRRDTSVRNMERIVADAVDRAATEGRNNAWFVACNRLIDAGFERQQVEDVLPDFVSTVAEGDHPFTAGEALRTLESAFSRRAEPCEQQRDAASDEPAPDPQEARETAFMLMLDAASRLQNGDLTEELVQVLAASGVNDLGCESLLKRLRRETKAVSATEARLIISEVKKTRDSAEGDEQPGGEGTTKQRLIQIALQAELFHSGPKASYAAVERDDGVRMVMPVTGQAFKRYLAYRYFQSFGDAPAVESVGAVVAVADARAIYDGRFIELHNRFRADDDSVLIDLGDQMWRAIRVDRNGFAVEHRPPITFERQLHQLELPEPATGDLKSLLPFLNLATEDDEILVLCWLVTAAIAHIPRWIMVLKGLPGTSKTTTTRLLRSLLDPSVASTIDLGRNDPAELAQLISQSAIPCFDNLSTLQRWQEDLLCRAVTGGGFMKRSLFTNDGVTLFQLKRALIITALEVPTQATDLLDRCLILNLSPIDESKRIDERTLFSRFEAVRPSVLGGLLDALARTIALRPTLVLPRMPRMADATLWGAAAAEALGYGKERFLRALKSNAGQRVDAALEDPIVDAVRQLLDRAKNGYWTGSPKALYDELTAIHGNAGRYSRWPGNASQLGKRLRALAPPLSEAGIGLDMGKRGTGDRFVMVYRIGHDNDPQELPVTHPTET